MHRPALLAGALTLVLCCACVEPARVESDWTALGLSASAEVWATTERTARLLVEEFPGAMERVEATMSLERSGSELNRINHEAADAYYRVEDHDLFRAVALGVDYAKASGGTYDPTLGPVLRLYAHEHPEPPGSTELAAALASVGWESVALERHIFAVRLRKPGMELDLDGLIEGYAIDVAARKFVRTGSVAGVLRLGHHVYTWGRPPGVNEWWVGVTDPRSAIPRPLFELSVASSRGVGLSGSGGAAEPVIDPRTGEPASSDVLVAAAVADSVADAIAVSRALLVGGSMRAGVLLGQKTRRVEAVLLVAGANGPEILASATLQGRLALSDPLAAETTGGMRYLLPPTEMVGRLD